MNFETSKTSDPHRFIDLKRSDRYVALSNLSINYTLKNIQMSYKNNKFKIRGMKSLSYLIDHIKYQIFKII